MLCHHSTRRCKAPDDAAGSMQCWSMLLTAGEPARGSMCRAWHAVLQLRVGPAQSRVREGLRCPSLLHTGAVAALQPERGERCQAARCRRHEPLHRLRIVSQSLPQISGVSLFQEHA